MVEMVPPVRPSAAALRAGFAALDEWQLEEVFAHRGSLMRSAPRFLWGSFRVATKLALEEILKGEESGNVLQQERAWKLFLLLPRMMLHRFSHRRRRAQSQVGCTVRQVRFGVMA